MRFKMFAENRWSLMLNSTWLNLANAKRPQTSVPIVIKWQYGTGSCLTIQLFDRMWKTGKLSKSSAYWPVNMALILIVDALKAFMEPAPLDGWHRWRRTVGRSRARRWYGCPGGPCGVRFILSISSHAFSAQPTPHMIAIVSTKLCSCTPNTNTSWAVLQLHGFSSC